MKILWLTENYPPNVGGMSNSCDRIVYNLRKNSVLVHVVHLTQRVGETKMTTVQNGRDILFPAHADIAHTLNCMWIFLENLHKEEKYTHIVAFGGYFPMFSAPIFSAWLEIPLVTLIRGNDFDSGIFTPRKQKFLEDCLKKSAMVCCVSKDKVFKINKLYKEVSVCYIPNGINLSEWQSLALDEKNAKNWRNTHISPLKKVIGIFGHLKDKKGVLFFLQELQKSGLQDMFHLLIVGEIGAEVQDFLQENQKESEKNQVDGLQYSHYPFMETFELLSHYLACDIVAIPSFYDGLPNVLLEVGALGVPLIASNAAGMADVLAHNENALLFEPANSSSCREMLILLAQMDKNTLQNMGKNLQKHISENLTHEQEMQRYKKMFEEIK